MLGVWVRNNLQRVARAAHSRYQVSHLLREDQESQQPLDTGQTLQVKEIEIWFGRFEQNVYFMSPGEKYSEARAKVVAMLSCSA